MINTIDFENYFKPWFLILLLVSVIIWDVIIRAVSLWKSARNGQRIWFIFLTIINSMGILPVIYLLFFQKKSKK